MPNGQHRAEGRQLEQRLPARREMLEEPPAQTLAGELRFLLWLGVVVGCLGVLWWFGFVVYKP
jgi:hypothetical protein